MIHRFCAFIHNTLIQIQFSFCSISYKINFLFERMLFKRVNTPQLVQFEPDIKSKDCSIILRLHAIPNIPIFKWISDTRIKVLFRDVVFRKKVKRD